MGRDRWTNQEALPDGAGSSSDSNRGASATRTRWTTELVGPGRIDAPEEGINEDQDTAVGATFDTDFTEPRVIDFTHHSLIAGQNQSFRWL